MHAVNNSITNMNKNIVINRQFCGPPDSGHGGYVCGVMARFIDGVAEVTLRKPPPLDQPLRIEQLAASKFLLKNGDEIVAEAQSANLDLDVPTPPDYEQAKEAAQGYRGFDYHPSPSCFGCGTERVEGDGLRIFAGPVAGSQVVATTWIPDIWLSDNNGDVKPEFLWSALDCPGFYATYIDQGQMMLLGRFVVKIDGQVKSGEKYVLIGWEISKSGRKHYVGTALFSESGELCVKAKATWIQI